MIKLIQFEVKKITKSTFFKLMILASCLAIFTFYYYIYANTQKVEDLILREEFVIFNTQEAIQENKNLIEAGEGSKSELEREIAFHENWIEKSEATLKAYKEEDWVSILSMQIDQDEPWVNRIVSQPQSNTSKHPTDFTLETNLEQNKLIRDREIVPIYPINTSMTIYDTNIEVYDVDGKLITDEKVINSIIRHATKFSSSGLYYLYTVIGISFSFIGVSFLLLLFGDVMTKEGLGGNGSIRFLYTQPLNRNKILISKFLSILIVTAIILVGIGAISLATGTIFDRFGNWNYPILIYGEEYAFTFMNLSTFIIKSTLLFFMILLFSYSLLFLFSILTRNVLTSIGLTFAVIYFGITLVSEPVTSAIVSRLPFNFFSVGETLSQKLAVTLDNFDLTFSTGVITLAVSFMIIWILIFLVTFVQRRYNN